MFYLSHNNSILYILNIFKMTDVQFGWLVFFKVLFAVMSLELLN